MSASDLSPPTDTSAAPASSCHATPGDAAPGHAHAHGVDPEIRDRNLKRLRRIEGQVRGVQRMVEENRYCPDILVQIASIQQALRGVSREVMRNHLAHCAADAERTGGDAAEEMRGELLDLIFKYLR